MAKSKKITEPKKSRGRPTKMTPEVQKEILEKISCGKSLVKILLSSDRYPAYTNFCQFLNSDEDFRQMYARAKEDQAEYLAEEIIDISDDGTNDTYIDEEGKPRVDHDNIQRSKLRVDSRKWIASKLKPRKFGEKVMNELTIHEDDKVNAMSDEQVDKLLEERGYVKK